MALCLDHFHRRYGSVVAVEDLSFAVASGEIVGLIGPNGAGKTTTLRSLAGVLKPSGGRVSIDGFDIVRQPIDAKRRLAFMPDEPHLFEYLTVVEHLQLVGRLYEVPNLAKLVGAILEELELTGREGLLPGELSRGMRQKVVIACGLVRDATTLLFDEPLTGLDPIGIRRMRDTIVGRARGGAAILLSSHLLPLVEEVCSRVVIMDRGRKVADGAVADLAALVSDSSSLEQIFLQITGRDLPPMAGSESR